MLLINIYVLANELDGWKYLQIWSWEGVPIAHYILDQSVDTFVVSEKYKKYMLSVMIEIMSYILMNYMTYFDLLLIIRT